MMPHALSPVWFRASVAPHLVSDPVKAWARQPAGDELGRVLPGDEVALKDAAVLFGLVSRADGPNLILTTRTEALRAHGGQVALPGGRIDPGDADPEQAALREAGEEIGLAPAQIETLGYFVPYVTGSGYRIMPVVAMVDPAYEARPNVDEVTDVFEVPLAFLLDPANARVGSRVWNGQVRRFYEMPWTEPSGRERYIWGVTAGIIRQMSERVGVPWSA